MGPLDIWNKLNKRIKMSITYFLSGNLDRSPLSEFCVVNRMRSGVEFPLHACHGLNKLKFKKKRFIIPVSDLANFP